MPLFRKGGKNWKRRYKLNLNYIDNQLVVRFKPLDIFTKQDLLEFYQHYEPDLNEGTFGWRIFDLKRRNIVKTVRKGVYSLHKETFLQEPDQRMVAIGRLLESSFPQPAYCIWNTNWLNRFTELQATSSLIIVEIEKDLVESAFNLLRDRHFQSVFLKPDGKEMERYVSELREAIIIKPIISRAPTEVSGDITIPALEKILVDLYCDEKILFAFQGSQLIKIYKSVFDHYAVNISRMLNYAKRRKREEGIRAILTMQVNEKVKRLME
jgi:hypothetical protein